MDEEKLRQLIKPESESQPKRSWRCPSENELAAYVEGQLAGIKRQRLEGHFANCNWCFEALAFLGQTAEEPAPDVVPGHLITRARTLAQNQPVNARWNWATAGAVVCLLIFATFILWRLRVTQTPVPPVDLVAQNQPTPMPIVQSTIFPEPSPRAVETSKKATPAETHPVVVRGNESRILPAIISPREGAVISKDKAFTWSGVENARLYEVKVVTNDGTPVFKELVAGTQLPLRLQSALQPGSEYFVAIEAHLSDGRVIRSKLVKFKVAP